MAQSSKAAGRGQRKGSAFRGPRPPTPSVSVSVSPSLGHSAPSASSEAVGVSQPTYVYDAAAARQQAQLKKYPLWKYVTKKQVPKTGPGGNVHWSCNFCKGEFKSTYFRVKGHLLGLPCGIGACKTISQDERMDLVREDAAGSVNVVAASRKNEDPLPFLRNSNISRFGRKEIQPTKKRAAQTYSGPMDKIFRREERDEVDLTLAFFFLSQLHFF